MRTASRIGLLTGTLTIVFATNPTASSTSVHGGTVAGGNERLETQSQAMCFRDPAGKTAGGFGETAFDLVPTIAFASSRDNPTLLPVLSWSEIYLLDIDFTNPRRLTYNDASDIFPALSPDGKKIVFESGRLRQPTDPINVADLWVMGADGEEQTALITRAGSASWAPNSKDVVFHGSASGTGLPIVGNPGAATSDSDIFVMNIDDCIEGSYGARNITNDPDHIDDDPDWSPVEDRIVFTSHLVNDNHVNATSAEIWTMNPDGTDRVRLTFNSEEERAPAWSPDGTKILYACRALWLGSGSDFEVCIMNADGSDQHAITNNTTPDLTANWSPDGSKIILHRPVGTGNINQLFRMNADGTNIEQMTTPPGHNLFANPGWIRARQAPGRATSSTSRTRRRPPAPARQSERIQALR
jgi:TolB protein